MDICSMTALELGRTIQAGEASAVEAVREALDRMAQSPCPILFYERAVRPLGELLAPRPAEIAILIGAEGGFSPEEAGQAAEAGLAVCTMGPRILRCETAPLYALSAIGYTYENLHP